MIEQHIDSDPVNTDTASSVIDLRYASNEQDILTRIGAVLRGSLYQHDVSRPNMDMLQELVENWYSEQWGNQQTIVILGAKDRLHDQSMLMLELILLLSRAEMWAMERCLRSDAKADTITPYLSLRICLA